MNTTRKPFGSKPRLSALTLALSLAGASAIAHADELSDPKAAPGNAVTAGATKGSFKLPGADTSVTIGGYVKLDAIFSDKSVGVDSVGDQQLNASLIPVGPAAGTHKKDQVTLHARQTRLSLATSTPTMRPTATARATALNRARRRSTSAGRRSTRPCGAAPGRRARACRARRWTTGWSASDA